MNAVSVILLIEMSIILRAEKMIDVAILQIGWEIGSSVNLARNIIIMGMIYMTRVMNVGPYFGITMTETRMRERERI